MSWRVYKKDSKRTKWTIAGRDHNLVKRQMPAFKNEDLSRKFAQNIAEIVEFKRLGTPLPPLLAGWTQDLAPDIKGRLAAIGLLDDYSKSLDEHLIDYELSLKARGNTPQYINQSTGRIRKMIKGCGFRYWSDIKGSKLEQFIAGLQSAKDRTATLHTRNSYLKDMKGFCRWALRDGRITASPIEYLRPINPRKVRNEPRRVRRALSADEVLRLLEKTVCGPTRSGMMGPERAMLYLLAVETGLRSSELRSLTSTSFKLDGEEPSVWVSGRSTKNNEPAQVPLRERTVSALRAYLENRSPDSPAFPMPQKYNVITMLRADLKDAKIPHQTENEKVDFHSLRHTCGSLLASAGVHPKIIQRIMRTHPSRLRWIATPTPIGEMKPLRLKNSQNSIRSSPLNLFLTSTV